VLSAVADSSACHTVLRQQLKALRCSQPLLTAQHATAAAEAFCEPQRRWQLVKLQRIGPIQPLALIESVARMLWFQQQQAACSHCAGIPAQ
jgi:hypothetical protein